MTDNEFLLAMSDMLDKKLICNDFCQEVNLKNHHKFIEF